MPISSLFLFMIMILICFAFFISIAIISCTLHRFFIRKIFRENFDMANSPGLLAANEQVSIVSLI
jgi:hypothetical protein